jgi:hypothetical protein
MRVAPERVREFGESEEGLRQASDRYHRGACHQTGWTTVVADAIHRQPGMVASRADVRRADITSGGTP